MKFAWLIEAPGPSYLAAGGVLKRFHWVLDANKALWFATEQQANDTLDSLRELIPEKFAHMAALPSPTHAVEHGFEP